MKKIVYIAAIPALFLMACNDNKPEKDTSLEVPVEATIAPAADTAATTETADGSISPLVNDQPTSAPTTVSEPTKAAPVPAKTSTTAALNPEHGQPGHRCDIPVGAPLNTPAQASGPQNTINPINMAPNPNVPIAQPSLPSKISTGGSGKLNPAHGEPGHDCAVPVGSPLP